MIKQAGTIDPDNFNKRDELEKIITNIGKTLIMSGLPSDKISSKIQRAIERQYRNNFDIPLQLSQAWYYNVMKKNKWPESAKVHKKITPVELNSTYSIKNQRIITSIDIMTRSLNEFRRYLLGHPYVSLLPEDFIDQITIMIESSADNLINYMNERHVIPNQSMLIFWSLYNEHAGMASLFNAFFDDIRANHLKQRNVGNKIGQVMTKKEVQQVISRKLVNLNPLLDFSTSNESILCGFSGQQCPICKGYRTISSEGGNGKMTCIACRGKVNFKLFPKEIRFACPSCKYLLNTKNQIKKQVKCRSCGTKHVVPEEFQKEPSK